MTTPPHHTPQTDTETQFQRYPLLMAQIKQYKEKILQTLVKLPNTAYPVQES